MGEPEKGPDGRTGVCVLGSYVQDLAFFTGSFPEPGESRIGTFRPGPGGKGFNQAVACHRQGVDTVFIGAVGDDAFAAEARKFIAEEGLATALEVMPETRTGAASVVISEAGQNQIVVALGANDALSAEAVEQHRGRIEDAGLVLCQAETGLSATAHALAIARESGALTILNPAPVNQGLSRELTALADILIPNESEFGFLMRHVFDTELPDRFWTADDRRLHSYCRRTGAAVVILTLGDKGVFVSLGPDAASGPGGFDLNVPYFRLAAARVDARDTTGAGDAFCGGLAAGLIRFGRDLHRAVTYATVVAGLSTQTPGTAPAMPRRSEVDRFIAETAG